MVAIFFVCNSNIFAKNITIYLSIYFSFAEKKLFSFLKCHRYHPKTEDPSRDCSSL